MKPITITRDNYKNFCEEADLTKNEWRQLFAMRRQIRGGDLELQAHVETKVAREQEAHDIADHVEIDWSGMVQWSDTLTRLRRAQIAAYQEWQERK